MHMGSLDSKTGMRPGEKSSRNAFSLRPIPSIGPRRRSKVEHYSSPSSWVLPGHKSVGGTIILDFSLISNSRNLCTFAFVIQ